MKTKTPLTTRTKDIIQTLFLEDERFNHTAASTNKNYYLHNILNEGILKLNFIYSQTKTF